MPTGTVRSQAPVTRKPGETVGLKLCRWPPGEHSSPIGAFRAGVGAARRAEAPRSPLGSLLEPFLPQLQSIFYKVSERL